MRRGQGSVGAREDGDLFEVTPFVEEALVIRGCCGVGFGEGPGVELFAAEDAEEFAAVVGADALVGVLPACEFDGAGFA